MNVLLIIPENKSIIATVDNFTIDQMRIGILALNMETISNWWILCWEGTVFEVGLKQEFYSIMYSNELEESTTIFFSSNLY